MSYDWAGLTHRCQATAASENEDAAGTDERARGISPRARGRTVKVTKTCGRLPSTACWAALLKVAHDPVLGLAPAGPMSSNRFHEPAKDGRTLLAAGGL